jgi:hypothetical protein
MANETAARVAIWLLVAGAGAAAYGFYDLWHDERTKERRRQQEVRAARDLAAPPKFREIKTQHGVLLEMQVPTDPMNSGFVDYQICYVWRDASTQSASLSCPNRPEIDFQAEMK